MEAVGIDTSTKAIALGCYKGDREVHHQIYKLTGINLNQQMAGAYNCMEKWLMDIRAEGRQLKIFIEKPVFAQSHDIHMKLSCIYASVALACIDFNFFPEAVNNMTWKKSVVGWGNATKDDIKEKALEIFEVEDDCEQDIYDALCVAKYGWDWDGLSV